MNIDFNPYEKLAILETATLDEIKQAFRRKAKETHPDLHGGSAEYAKRFREVAEAYAILSDIASRHEYDSQKTVDDYAFREAQATAYDIENTIYQMRQMLKPYRDKARNAGIVGSLWAIGGLLVTIISLALAEESGVYYIMWGAIIFGAIQAIRGFMRMSQINKVIDEAEKEMWDSVDK
jgi:curved DNA-binding protein CbpA